MGIEPKVMQLREAFQAAWKTGSRLSIAELIGDLEEPARTAALRELVTLDVEYRRRSGESPYASEYVAQFPADRDLIESLFSDTQSLVGEMPPETLLRPAGKPVKPDSSIEATRTSIGAKEDRNQLTPTPSPSPTEDRSKSIVPLKEFIRSLTESGLMDRDELDAFIASLPSDHRPENGKQLAQELHRCKKLTRFQVQAVYQGKTRGLVVGNYVVLDKLGEGGMGQVYKARHKRMDRVVALKVLPAAATKSPESAKRFQREVKAAAKLTHPKIVTAYDADEHRGVHFLVMEYVEGKDLAGFVREKGPLPVKQAVDCIIQAAKGLEYAHRQGIIHRDIKPHNLLLDKSGTVKILDMGLARLDEQIHKQADDDGLTRSGAVMGTLDYMSPEQAMDTKTADARADIYSLGCTLHFLLTGKPPYSGDSLAAKIVAHRVQPVPSLRVERKDVPEALDAVFQKMLAKTADARQASMEVLLQELEQSRFAIDVGDSPEIGLASPAREEPLDLMEEETTTLADPAGSSVDMTKRWVAPSVGPATESRSWLQEYKTLLIGLAMLVPATLILALGIMVTLRTKTGDLIVEVNELGAKVEVLDAEGKVVVTGVSDKNPLTFSVDSGQHRIRVEKNGFVVYTEQIDIESRGKKSVTARLERNPAEQGTLVLKGAEAGALVEVLDTGGKIQATYRTKGPELSIPMDAGSHRIRIEKDGAEVLAQDVSVAARASVDLDTSAAFQAKKQTVATQPVATPESAPKPTPPADTAADQDRTIGALVLGLGGKLTISVDGAEREVTSVDQFPKTPFAVVKIDLDGKTAVNDDAVKSIATLKSVQWLLLNGTHATDAAMESVAHMPTLMLLYIDFTGVSESGIMQLTECQSLQSLGLEGLPLTDRCLPAIARLQNLSSLALDHTPISDEGLKQLWPLRRLNHLCLGGTKITDDGLLHLRRFEGLNSVRLADMKNVTAKGLQKLFEESLISHFELQNTPVGDESLAAIAGNPLVQYLDLSGTNVTDQGLRHLEGLLNPQIIRLSGTRVTAAGVRRLGERFPCCEIAVNPELATAIPPRGRRVALAPTSASDASAYSGLAPGKWVSLLPSRKRQVGWVISSAEVQNVDGNWAYSSSPITTCGRLWTGLGKPRDVIWRLKTKGADWKHLAIAARNADFGIGRWHAYSLILSPNGDLTLQDGRNDGAINLGRSQLPPSFEPGAFEIAFATVGRQLAAFINGVNVLTIDDSDSQQAGVIDFQCVGSVTLESIDCQILDYVTTPTIQKILDAPTDIQRETAEWILRLGGTLSITKDGIESTAPTAKSLPASPFSIVRVSMVGAKDLMTDLALSKLGRLTDLQSLDVTGVPIGDAGLEHLKNAKNLKNLNLVGTNVTSAGFGRLSVSLPACRIVGPGEIENNLEEERETALLQKEPPIGGAPGRPRPAIKKSPFDSEKAREYQEAWARYLGMAVRENNSIGMSLTLVPPGEFDMGEPDVDIQALLQAASTAHVHPDVIQWIKGSSPLHRVLVSRPFYLGTYEVTVKQFRNFVAETGYRTSCEPSGGSAVDTPNWHHLPFPQGEDHPVVCLSWNDCVAFCRWLSKREGVRYWLPTEAQWEYACRAGTTFAYGASGDLDSLKGTANLADMSYRSVYPDNKGFDVVPWDDKNPYTCPVGLFQPNGFGLCDMLGNAWEWCADRFAVDYYANSPEVDPKGPTEGVSRVLRGCSWDSRPHPGGFRIGQRASIPQWAGESSHRGFRVMRAVVESPQ